MNFTKEELDNAPEDATHVGDCDQHDIIPYYKLEGDHWFWKHYSCTSKYISENWTYTDFPYYNPTRALPLKSPKGDEKPAGVPAWIPGIDLPPIGEKVEIAFDLNNEGDFKYTVPEGTIVEILAHMKVYDTDEQPRVAIFRVKTKDVNTSYVCRQAVARCFRKAPTPEEVAAAKKEKALKKVLDDIGGSHDLLNDRTGVLLSNLYDQGKLVL